MTPEQHNKYLAYSNFAYGGLFALFALLMMIFMFGMMTMTPNGPPAGVIVFMSLFIGIIYGVMILPSFIAGWALLKRKKWARTASIISGVVAGANFPFGTAVCIYTFWFLYGKGARLYDKSALASRDRFSLRDGSPSTFEFIAGSSRERREHEYVPPPQMPNWRD